MELGFAKESRTAEFRYSRSSRIGVVVATIFDALFSLAFVAIPTYVVATGELAGTVLWAGALVMYCVAFVFLTRAWLAIKYRHILMHTYLVGVDGVSIHGGPSPRHIHWGDFSLAEYLPVVPLYRLYEEDHPKPIVLFIFSSWRPNSTTNSRNSRAKEIIEQGMGRRLKTRWLPW